jgi:poly(hydroxyalkanoate) granule-associated protein
MARKSKKSRSRDEAGSGDTAQAVRDSAQKIWLAGLGAFERAKSDGPRMFESLVEQGRNMGARAVGAADEALKNMRQAEYGGARWDKLEEVFQDRVAKSLHRLGVITSREVEDLSRQVQELNETVRNLMPRDGSGGKARGKATRAGKKRAGTSRKAAAPAAAKAGRKASARRPATRGSRARQA